MTDKSFRISQVILAIETQYIDNNVVNYWLFASSVLMLQGCDIFSKHHILNKRADNG